MYANVGIIGIVKEEIKQDYWGTCRELVKMGYKALECEAPLDSENVCEDMKRIQNIGLRHLAVRGDRYTIEEKLEGILDRAEMLRAQYVIVYWGPTESKEQVLADAEMYNRVGAKCAEKGLKFCYHNHDHEFTTIFEDRCVFDLYLEHTDPQKVYFELDTAWATFGGINPVKILADHGNRIPIIHLKDLSDLKERGHFTAVGTGLVNTKGIMQAASETGVEWVVIEQDKLNHMTGLETAAASIYNLRELGFVEPTYIAPPPTQK